MGGRLVRAVGAQLVVALTVVHPVWNIASAQTNVAVSTSSWEARRITISLEAVPLPAALTRIAREAGLTPAYNSTLLPQGTVTLHLRDVLVSTAFQEALRGTRFSARIRNSGDVTIVPKDDEIMVSHVEGRITDGATKKAIPGVSVTLDGTNFGQRTSEDGVFRLTGVPAGKYTLVARRLGYSVERRVVQIMNDSVTKIDLMLTGSVTPLDQVVTTVTGPQRRLELGNNIGIINADSVMREAPVSTLSELLSGRVPGLQVSQKQGTVGGQVRLQVRGANSTSLNTEPIVIIDGMRYKSQHDADANPGLRTASDISREMSSPLNDLNPNDIETLEVVKGPSATTLYGTDASNGVIVITTKRGRAGQTRWNTYVKGSVMTIPKQRAPDLWWGWSHDGSGAVNPYNCLIYDPSCSHDSVTTFANPVNDPRYNMFAAAPTWNYGFNVSGGRPEMRYYLSGDLIDATGPLKMPAASVQQIKAYRGTSKLKDNEMRPNTMTDGNARANVTVSPRGNLDVTLNTGYTRRTTNTVSPDVYLNALNVSPFGTYTGYPQANPTVSFSTISQDLTNRFQASGNAQWRPFSWLATRGVMGLDYGQIRQSFYASTGTIPDSLQRAYVNDGGRVADTRADENAITGEMGLTASFSRGAWSSRTSVGSQYVRNTSDGLNAMATGLQEGQQTLNGGTVRSLNQTVSQTATLGTYFEEMIGFREQLFVTVAMRADGASTFGQHYKAVVYPKVGLSWIASRSGWFSNLPGVNELRLRYALGASGQQPTQWMKLPYINYSSTPTATGTARTLYVDGGNPELRPERVREQEGGLDMDLFDTRLQSEFTWFGRRTTDMIVGQDRMPGFAWINTNLGLVTQHGYELQLTGHLLNTRPLSLDMTFQHAYRTTKLVRLGTANPGRSGWGGYAEGYPIGSRFYRPIVSYSDANGDGILRSREIKFADSTVYGGVVDPPTNQNLSIAMGMLDRRIRLSALLNRQSGFTAYDLIDKNRCLRRLCRSAVDPTTPLSEQLQNWTDVEKGGELYIRPADFTRLREVSLVMDAPASVSRMLRGRSAALTISARNLALWSRFGAHDPESGSADGSLYRIVNAIPQGRTWMFRFDVGF